MISCQTLVLDYDYIESIKSHNKLHYQDIRLALPDEESKFLFKISLKPSVLNTQAINKTYIENYFTTDISTYVYLVNNEHIMIGNLVSVEYNSTDCVIFTYQFRLLNEEIFSLIYCVLQLNISSIENNKFLYEYCKSVSDSKKKVYEELDDYINPTLSTLGTVEYNLHEHRIPDIFDSRLYDYNIHSCDLELYKTIDKSIIHVYQTSDDNIFRITNNNDAVVSDDIYHVVYDNIPVISKLKYIPKEISNLLTNNASTDYYYKVKTDPTTIEDFLCIMKYTFCELEPFDFVVNYNAPS